LTNEDDLVEINNDFPDSLIDSLEFGDNFIRTLFDGLLRKYIVQPAKAGSKIISFFRIIIIFFDN
jgi:hypothetical protein